MTITTNDDWQWVNGGYETAFATTSDPRVVAVIQREDDRSISELFDGDAINPIIYVSHRFGELRFHHEAGYEGGDEAELMQRAYDEWGWNGTARRWLWIFYGIAAENAWGGDDRDGNWIVATSNKYNEHVGNERYVTYEDARKDCEAIAKELADALDGQVYGIGFATNEARVLDSDDEIDLDSFAWITEIEIWGYIGEDYAKESAARFDGGEPMLEPMLELPAELNEPGFIEHTDRMANSAADGWGKN